jgi:hypothetical protein
MVLKPKDDTFRLVLNNTKTVFAAFMFYDFYSNKKSVQ